MEKNKAELEAAPLGAYAVAPSQPANPSANADGADPGVIFLLRQTNDRDINPRQRAASPVHPFSLVYIKNDGTIRYGCAGIRQALELFEKTAAGHAEPIICLCAQFDSETQNGRDMARYDRLLNAVIAHINGANKSTQVQHLGLRGQRDFKLPTKTQNSTLDFELVTWLVIV